MNNPKHDWDKILNYIDEHKDIQSMTKMADMFGINRVTLVSKYQGYLIGKESIVNDPDKHFKSIARRENNIKKKMLELNIQRREINLANREDLFYDKFSKDFVIDKFKNLITKEEKEKVIKNKKTPDGHQFVYYGDIHFKEKETSREDLKIFLQSLLKEYDGKSELHMIGMGDFIENTHHRQQVIQKRTTVMEQIVGVSQGLISIFKEMIKIAPKMHLYFIEGNHDEIRQMGANSRDDVESVVHIIRELVEVALKDYGDKVVIYDLHDKDEDKTEFILGDRHIQHGHNVKGDFIRWMEKRNSFYPEKFRDINVFLKAHSHKYDHIVPKGTGNSYINVPCIKRWVSKWEKDNNQIFTSGYVIEKKGDYKLCLLQNEY